MDSRRHLGLRFFTIFLSFGLFACVAFKRIEPRGPPPFRQCREGEFPHSALRGAAWRVRGLVPDHTTPRSDARASSRAATPFDLRIRG